MKSMNNVTKSLEQQRKKGLKTINCRIQNCKKKSIQRKKIKGNKNKIQKIVQGKDKFSTVLKNIVTKEQTGQKINRKSLETDT